MQIYNELTFINNSSLALGYFDGLHLGHKVVLKNAINVAKKNNTLSTVVMFRTHPMFFLTGKNIEQILTVEERIEFLKMIGIDNVVILDFKDFATVRANDYLKNIIVKYFSPIAITTGFNHSFGYNKEGNSGLLKENELKYEYKYYEIPPFTIEGNVVSCSVIKNMLHLGNFYDANKLLGYKYFINASVVKGDGIASTIGFPSANIVYPEVKINIPLGVYFVLVNIDNKIYNGVLNHGFSPTLKKETKIKTEVHIIDFNQNIYGKKIKISFVSKIRNQMRFENIEKLQAQIKRDIAFTNIYSKFLKSL